MNTFNESAVDIKTHVSTQCKSLGDRLAHALEVFASSLNYTQTQRSLEDLTYQINQMKSHVTDLPKDLAQASVVEEQLQALCSTITESLDEVKTDNHHLLSTFEESSQTISAKNDENDSRMLQLITNQEIIIKQFNCNIDEDENNSGTIKESLKQIHEIISKYYVNINPKDNVKSAIQEIHHSLKSFQSVLIASSGKNTLSSKEFALWMMSLKTKLTNLEGFEINMEENSDKVKELLDQVEDQFHENSAATAENNSISNIIRKGSRKRKLSSSSSASSPSTVRRTSSRRQKTTYNDDSTDNNFDN